EISLPAEAADAAAEFMRLIEAADRFCRRGDLMTLALDDELRSYLDWYLGDIRAQLAGSERRPWEGCPRYSRRPPSSSTRSTLGWGSKTVMDRPCVSSRCFACTRTDRAVESMNATCDRSTRTSSPEDSRAKSNRALRSRETLP